MTAFKAEDSLGNKSPKEIADYLEEIGDLDTANAIREEAGIVIKRRKATYVGAPAVFALEIACQDIVRAFPEAYGCYLVGSALERPDWRDVDVRMLLPDDDFRKLFPAVQSLTNASWEFDARWLLLCVSITENLSKRTGLPIDFQIQPAGFANERHTGLRNALGMV